MNDSILLMLKLVLAHILGDFALQSNAMNLGKRGIRKDKQTGEEIPITRSKQLGYLVIHSGTHSVLAYLIVCKPSYWIIPLVTFVSHFLIDLLKIKFSQAKSIRAFTIDQVCHLTIIVGLTYFYRSQFGNIFQYLGEKDVYGRIIVLIIAYLIIAKPTSILLDLCLKQLTPNAICTDGLNNGGKWIGYLERFLIVTFILLNNFGAIGFLVTAKSIFRFGELNKGKELKTTEYVLIGTLASFTIAIVVGLVSKLLLNITPY